MSLNFIIKKEKKSLGTQENKKSNKERKLSYLMALLFDFTLLYAQSIISTEKVFLV